MAYHDPTKDVTLRVDALTTGLGGALLQDKKVIAFANKASTDVESRSAYIEREILAVVYGCERFHTYPYGRRFIAESNHKPLEAIQLKNLISATLRLQRMLLRWQPYEVTMKYRPGKQMLVADALSRPSSEEETPIPDVEWGKTSPFSFWKQFWINLRSKKPAERTAKTSAPEQHIAFRELYNWNSSGLQLKQKKTSPRKNSLRLHHSVFWQASLAGSLVTIWQLIRRQQTISIVSRPIREKKQNLVFFLMIRQVNESCPPSPRLNTWKEGMIAGYAG